MAKYAHVDKSLGTRVIAETKTAQETGVFGAAGLEAADVYASLSSVKTNAGLSDGDFVIYANDHDSAYGANTQIDSLPSLTHISVDNQSAGNYLAGAKEKTASTAHYLIFRGSLGKVNTFHGVSVVGGNRFDSGFLEDYFNFNNADINITSGAMYISNNDGSKTSLKNCDIDLGSGYFRLQGGANFDIDGGTLVGTISASAFQSVGFSGFTATIKNNDMSGLTSTNIFRASASIQDFINASAIRCRLPASINEIENDAIGFPTHTVDFWSCDNGDGYHYFSHWRHEGHVVESTTVTRTSGATYDGTNGFTAQFIPSTNVDTLIKPLRHLLAAPVINIKDVDVIVEINVFLQNPSSGTPTLLTDKNCVLKVVYPDSTTLALGKTVSSTTKDVLDAAANLTDVTDTFTGSGKVGNHIQHTLSATIPQNNNTGMDTATIEIWLELSVDIGASTEMFVCPKFDIG